MKEYYKELKERINEMISKSDSGKPACANCSRYCDGLCSLGSVNERNGNRYRFSNGRVTTADYSCGSFESKYSFSEETRKSLENIVGDIDRVNEELSNLELLESGKITEEDFNEILR